MKKEIQLKINSNKYENYDTFEIYTPLSSPTEKIKGKLIFVKTPSNLELLS